MCELSGKMLNLISDMDKLAGTRREFLLGTWLSDARSWGGTPEKDLCERNARELITVWPPNEITDDTNRQWNGLLGEFYHHRWQMWLQALNDSLARGETLDVPANARKNRDWELWWTRQTTTISNRPARRHRHDFAKAFCTIFSRRVEALSRVASAAG